MVRKKVVILRKSATDKECSGTILKDTDSDMSHSVASKLNNTVSGMWIYLHSSYAWSFGLKKCVSSVIKNYLKAVCERRETPLMKLATYYQDHRLSMRCLYFHQLTVQLRAPLRELRHFQWSVVSFSELVVDSSRLSSFWLHSGR